VAVKLKKTDIVVPPLEENAGMKTLDGIPINAIVEMFGLMADPKMVPVRGVPTNPINGLVRLGIEQFTYAPE
jgi:hypothetical protein